MRKDRQYRRLWSEEEDRILARIVLSQENQQKIKWKKVSIQINQYLPTSQRTPKQCRERHKNFIKFSGKEEQKWSVENDIKLIQSCKKYGRKWRVIFEQMNQIVNENNIKNHFYANIRKMVRNLNQFIRVRNKNFEQTIKQKGALIPEQEEIYKISKKIRRKIEPKTIFKMFNLLDQKHDFRYQSKQILSRQSIKQATDRILDLTQCLLTNSISLSDLQICQIIENLMQLSKNVKQKNYNQSLLRQGNQKQKQMKKKIKMNINKQLNQLVKAEYNFDIIPSTTIKKAYINKHKFNVDANKILKNTSGLKKIDNEVKPESQKAEVMDDENQFKKQQESVKSSNVINQNWNSYLMYEASRSIVKHQQEKEDQIFQNPFCSKFLNEIKVVNKNNSEGYNKEDDQSLKENKGIINNSINFFFNQHHFPLIENSLGQKKDKMLQRSMPLPISHAFSNSDNKEHEEEERSNKLFSSLKYEEGDKNSGRSKLFNVFESHQVQVNPFEQSQNINNIMEISQPISLNFYPQNLFDSRQFMNPFMFQSINIVKKEEQNSPMFWSHSDYNNNNIFSLNSKSRNNSENVNNVDDLFPKE